MAVGEHHARHVAPLAMPPTRAAAEPAHRRPDRSRLIPYWHTALLLLVLGGFSLLNAKSGHGAHSGHAHVRIYLATMVYEWLLTAYVWWGLRRAGLSSARADRRTLEERRRFSPRHCASRVGVWFGALMVIAVAAVAMGMDHSGSIDERPQADWFPCAAEHA